MQVKRIWTELKTSFLVWLEVLTALNRTNFLLVSDSQVGYIILVIIGGKYVLTHVPDYVTWRPSKQHCSWVCVVIIVPHAIAIHIVSTSAPVSLHLSIRRRVAGLLVCVLIPPKGLSAYSYLRWLCHKYTYSFSRIFRTCPDRPWGPPSLLYNGYRVFPGGKERPGRDADLSPPSSAVVMKG